jgi:REP element-mobilizing transposase RayT
MSKPYQISDQNGVQFLTITVVDWIDVFTRKEFKEVLIDSLNFCIQHKGLELYAWCLMSNHLHLLCRAIEPFKLSEVMRDFKRFTAQKILKMLERESIESRSKWMLNHFKFRGNLLKRNEKYKFWEDGVRAINIVSGYFFEQKLYYIHQNPVRAQIVEEDWHYLYSSARDYCGLKGLVEVSVY